MKLSAKFIERLNPEQRAHIGAFVAQHGRVFQHPLFLEAAAPSVSWITVEDEDKLIAVLALPLSAKARIRGYHVPPYAHYCGPVTSCESVDTVNEVFQKAIEAIPGYRLLEFKLPLKHQDISFYSRFKARIIPSQTHLIKVSDDYDLKSIHSSKRRYLKKLLNAMEDGELKLAMGEEASLKIPELQAQVAREKGFRYYPEQLQKIINNLGNEHAFSMILSNRQGEVLSGAYCPFDRNSAYHSVNATVRSQEGLAKYANILTAYLSVKEAHQRGLDFDFEGSNVPGVAKFYQMMGGKPAIFYRIRMAGDPIGKLWTKLLSLRQ